MPTPDALEDEHSSTRRVHLAVLASHQDRNPQGTIEGGAAADRPTLARQPRTPVGVAFGITAAALILWLGTSRSDTAALRGLPTDQRAAVAERGLSNLREVCRGPDRPRDFCREQAQIVLQLPECGEDCQAAARDELLADSAVK